MFGPVYDIFPIARNPHPKINIKVKYASKKLARREEPYNPEQSAGDFDDCPGCDGKWRKFYLCARCDSWWCIVCGNPHNCKTLKDTQE